MAKTLTEGKKRTAPRRRVGVGDAGMAPRGLSAQMLRRVIVEGVHPEVDAGRFPVRRTVGEDLTVGADIYTDGHDKLAAALLYRCEGDREWLEAPMTSLGNDRWQATFRVEELRRYEYTGEGGSDSFQSWRDEVAKKCGAAQDVGSE
ncbi:MAG: maltotransferase domain-containing protein, partial [Vicinamibacterales bacterium]